MSWKDHPIVIGAIAVVGTAIPGITFYEQSVIPTRTASLNYDLSRSKEEIVALQDQLKERDRLLLESNSLLDNQRSKSSALQEDLKSLQSKLNIERSSNPFIYDSPYPKGFGKVRVGSNVSLINKSFSNAVLDENVDSYTSVSFSNGGYPFNTATYYFNSRSDGEVITHILFFVNQSAKLGSDYLINTLSEVLGGGHELSRKGYYAWLDNKDFWVFCDSPNTYVIMTPGRFPGYWPERLMREAQASIKR